MSYNTLRVGNLVQYIGRVPGYHHHIGEIISIDPIEDEDTFLLRISNYKKEQNEIRAYKNDIAPLHLSIHLLERLGFEKEEQRNVFSLNGVNIIRPAFVKQNDNGLTLIDKGFVAVLQQVSFPPTEAEVEGNTESLPYMHSFQNYYQDNHNRQINTQDFV